MPLDKNSITHNAYGHSVNVGSIIVQMLAIWVVKKVLLRSARSRSER